MILCILVVHSSCELDLYDQVISIGGSTCSFACKGSYWESMAKEVRRWRNRSKFSVYAIYAGAKGDEAYSNSLHMCQKR